MGADYIPYRARRGDKVELGKPYGFGEETSLIEMPISWSLDDHPHFEFIRTPQTVTPGLRPARDGHAKLARRVSLHEEDRRLGRADLHHAPLCHRPRLPHAGAGGLTAKLAAGGAVFMTMEQAAEEAKSEKEIVPLMEQRVARAGRLGEMRNMPRHIVCLTFDFDTQSGFIARGMTTPTPLSRGEFGAMASRPDPGVPQGARHQGDLVRRPASPSRASRRKARRWSRAATRSATTAGRTSRPANQSRDEEEADLVRANESDRASSPAASARGYRSPSWDLSAHTIDLLIAHGFLYDIT